MLNPPYERLSSRELFNQSSLEEWEWSRFLNGSLFKAPDLPLLVFKNPHVTPRSAHDHDFLEIAVVQQGSGSQLSIRGEQSFKAGDVFILRPGVWHAYKDCHDITLYNCCIGVEVFQGDLATVAHDSALSFLLSHVNRHDIIQAHVDADSLQNLCQYLDTIISMANEKTPYSRSRLIGHLLLFLSLVGENLVSAHHEYQQRNTQMHEAVRRGIQLLESHPEHSWTLAKMSAQLHLNASYLVRLFKSNTGLSPMNYLMHYRVERAATLLLRSERSIADIGNEVGWSDASYFTQRFKAHFGITPSEYRNRYAPRN